MITLAAFAAIAFLLRGSDSGILLHSFTTAMTWDPARRWKESILLNTHSPPQSDSFRRELAWIVASLYTAPRPGFAKYQVREALLKGRIPLPPIVHDFLFYPDMPRDPVPRFLSHPVARMRRVMQSLIHDARAPRGKARRAADYVRSAEEVITFMETQLEMTHELDSDA